MTISGPSVTCIIIVYNGEAYLEEAIASVIRQSSPDWELIIADDGSSDASQEIARRHAQADSRIRLMTHPDGRNHGMSATRNLALAECRSDFVGFLDADDVWEATKLEEQLELMAQHLDVAMVYGRTLIWHSWQGNAAKDYFYDLGVQPNRAHAPPILFRNLLRNVYQTPTTSNALMRRTAVADVGGFDDSFTAMFEDQLFFAKMLLLFPVYVSDRSWAKYRQHQASASASSTPAGELVLHVRYLKCLLSFVRQQRRNPSMRHRIGLTDEMAVERLLVRLRLRGWVMKGSRMTAARLPW